MMNATITTNAVADCPRPIATARQPILHDITISYNIVAYDVLYYMQRYCYMILYYIIL